MKILPLIIALILITVVVRGQLPPVDVAELTLKVGGLVEKELYYGFAAGDQIIFSFEEMKGKPLKEIEIIELPTQSKFMDFKSSKIEIKKIKVLSDGIYKFRFYNGSMGGRICKIKIRRIPKTKELANFNTSWEWKTLYDTSYVPYTKDSLVGHDTTYKTVYRKELIKDDLVLEDVVVNNGLKVHSLYYNWAPLCDCYGDYNQTITSFDLPKTIRETHRIIENVSWIYGIGVDQELKRKSELNRKNLLNAGSSVSSALGFPQLAVVFELASALGSNSAEDVYYAIFPDYENAKLFNNNISSKVIKQDEIVSAGTVRMNDPLTGEVHFGFRNNNDRRGITVYLNVSVWRRIREYKDVEEQKQVVTPRYVTLNKKRMVVKTSQIRVNAK